MSTLFSFAFIFFIIIESVISKLEIHYNGILDEKKYSDTVLFTIKET
jgi:hypothetical protein